MKTSTSSPLLVLLPLSILLLSAPLAIAQGGPPPPSFTCTTNTRRCNALVGYKTPNTTTLSHIQSLFQVPTLTQLLGVNNLPLNTPSNHTIIGNSTVTIPFPCRCNNGTGVSNNVPHYTVVKDDGLFHIANQVYSGLVLFPQIQTANHIPDANLIYVGQSLWIPLPCSCDDVDGQPTVHYAHVVESGSNVSAIAAQFGVSPQTLMSLNGITDPRNLMAGQVLDVPFRACNTSVNRNSPDSPLQVAGGNYAITANNCIMCRCDATNNFTLQCQPSGLNPANWTTCPSNLQCSGSNLSLGNSTVSNCSRSTCAYAGYNNRTILTTLAVENTCPAPSGNNNGASDIHRRGLALAVVLLCLQLIMLQRFM